jgi:hypothetical protein
MVWSVPSCYLIIRIKRLCKPTMGLKQPKAQLTAKGIREKQGKISLYEAVEAYSVVRCRRPHNF